MHTHISRTIGQQSASVRGSVGRRPAHGARRRLTGMYSAEDEAEAWGEHCNRSEDSRHMLEPSRSCSPTPVALSGILDIRVARLTQWTACVLPGGGATSSFWFLAPAALQGLLRSFPPNTACRASASWLRGWPCWRPAWGRPCDETSPKPSSPAWGRQRPPTLCHGDACLGGAHGRQGGMVGRSLAGVTDLLSSSKSEFEAPDGFRVQSTSEARAHAIDQSRDRKQGTRDMRARL